MTKYIRFSFSLLILLLLGACYPNLGGTWTLTTTTSEWGSFPGCEELDKDKTFVFQVTQSGSELEGFSLLSTQNGNGSGQTADATLVGLLPAYVAGPDLELLFWVPNQAADDGCGEFWEASGSLDGMTVSGEFSGGDCYSEFAHSRLQKDGQLVEGCWWKGPFTAEISN